MIKVDDGTAHRHVHTHVHIHIATHTHTYTHTHTHNLKSSTPLRTDANDRGRWSAGPEAVQTGLTPDLLEHTVSKSQSGLCMGVHVSTCLCLCVFVCLCAWVCLRVCTCVRILMLYIRYPLGICAWVCARISAPIIYINTYYIHTTIGGI